MKEIKDLLRKLEPIMGARVRKLWHLYLVSSDPASVAENEALLRLLGDLRARYDYKHSIRLPPPSTENLAGDYLIGTVLYPDRPFADFGIREEEFVKHLLIVGMTGSGKTNLTFHILQELAKRRKPFLVFDWKRSYQTLKGLPELRDLQVIRLGERTSTFAFNPLIPPPGTDAKIWMTMLIDVINHAFFVGHGVEYFLRKGIHQLYERFGVYDGSAHYPTFADLEQLLRKEFVRGREMLWMSSVKRVLACLTEPSVLAQTVNVNVQDNIASLLEGPVVLEMDNLATLERIFLVESMLLWIYHYRKNQGLRGHFQHVIVIEEAHHMLSGNKEMRLGEETIIDTLIRMIREFGEGVIVIDQEPSKLSRSVLANTYCKICFMLGSGVDMRIMAQSMNLNEEDQDGVDQLRVGHAIIKIKDRFSQPIHVTFPFVRIDSNLP